MIINKAHDFGFVHIPKCAGSTIRQQLRDKDDAQGKFYHTMTIPELGKVNANHLPLAVLAAHFPQDFEALRAVTSYAIARAPMERFISSMAQYLRRDDQNPAEMSAAEIRKRTLAVIAELSASGAAPEMRHTIFLRQAGYVFLQGEKIIDHVYPMTRMEALFDRIETQHGFDLIRDTVWNPTVTYRFPLISRPLKSLKETAQKLLPVKTYASVRDLGFRLFTTRGVAALNDTLLNMSEVTAFVQDYYGEDKKLYQEALRATDPDKQDGRQEMPA
ncbi:hypothetical protein KX928_23630 [Roseobacter sp. YSTF-M11]|uniref:Sulfotransferase family protein n=1 Tax=Roseobacter insulae TaxID=2859783 RepID=A0A9X1G051_9RHOB|nr:hypothetical protein [Roseobacter insulae]MBW4710793.1 hypothetical protein [Roseobacter insulae]